jgi:hypothetical protein
MAYLEPVQMPNTAIYNRLKAFLSTHGWTITRGIFTAYETFCAANPDHWTCGDRASMVAFFQRKLMPKGSASASSAGPIGSREFSAPASIGITDLRISHKIRCEGDKLIMSGTDLVDQIATPSGPSAGTSLYTTVVSIAGSMFVNTRCKAFASLFEKYDFRKLRFHYTPAVATSTAGSLIMAWDNDPSDSIASQDVNGLRELFSFQSNAAGSAWTPLSLNCKLDKSTSSLFTSAGTDMRLYAAGRLQIANVSGLPASTTIGSLWVEYEVAFSSPSELISIVPMLSVANRGAAWTTGVANTSVLSVDPTVNWFDQSNAFPLVLSASGNLGFRVPPGTYFCRFFTMNSTAVGGATTTFAWNGDPVAAGQVYTSVSTVSTIAATSVITTISDAAIYEGLVTVGSSQGDIIIYPSCNQAGFTFGGWKCLVHSWSGDVTAVAASRAPY